VGTTRGVVAALAVGATAAAVCVTLWAPDTAQASSTRTLIPGSAISDIHAGTLLGAVSTSQEETVQVWLKADQVGADAFAAAVSTPGNAQFHHYLSPNAYTARFGPSAAHAAAVEAWLTSAGLREVGADSGRDYVSATGTVARIQSAFGVRINSYRVDDVHGRPTTVQAGDRDVSVPAALAPDVLAVTGLNGATASTSQTAARAAAPASSTSFASSSSSTSRPNTPTCSRYWAQHVSSFEPAYGRLTTGSLPVCGYSAGQLRGAYGATTAATGKGVTVALIENEAPVAMFATLTDYAKANGLPTPAASQFRQVQSTGAGGCGSAAASANATAASSEPSGTFDTFDTSDTSQMPYPDEAEMDSEALYAMAPGADQLMVVGGGCDEDQALLDASLSVLTGDGARPSASIESNSWQIPFGEVSAQAVHAIDVRAVAEGVGMYFAAGDTPGLTATDEDPDATVVGGTTLGIGAIGDRLFETGWSDDYADVDGGTWSDLGVSTASGGGTSPDYAQPAYQKGVVPASMSRITVNGKAVTDRAVPDIAADADTNTGMLTGYIATGTAAKPGPYQTEVNGGTSLACPLIAGLVADAQQGRTSPFGFINPLIYRLSGTSAFHDALPVTASTPRQDLDAYTPADGTDPASINTFDSQQAAFTTQVTAKGYDTMTGLGTPNGHAFITALRDSGSR
jgi:subtilase family serine protease